MPEVSTPLMQQYRDIKSRHANAIVFFRMGDFYEMFYEDAELASRELGLTLTARNNGGAADVPLAFAVGSAHHPITQQRDGKQSVHQSHQPHVQSHVAVQNVAVFMRDDTLQFVARQMMSSLRCPWCTNQHSNLV